MKISELKNDWQTGGGSIGQKITIEWSCLLEIIMMKAV